MGDPYLLDTDRALFDIQLGIGVEWHWLGLSSIAVQGCGKSSLALSALIVLLTE